MAFGNFLHMEAHGPVPVDDLPFEITRRQRAAGLCIMKLQSTRGKGGYGTGRTKRIAYLDDEHDPEVVVRAFLEANPGLTGRKSRHGLTALFGNHGHTWKQAASTVLDDYYESEQGTSTGRRRRAGETEPCPFCEADVLKGGLPSHLQKCPEK